MIHTLSKIKNTFPLMNFDFLDNQKLYTIINEVQGRFIGGVVRDGLLGISTYDIDISTNFPPQTVIDLLTKLNFNPVATGIEYGTISVFLKPYKIEITSLRKDVKTFGRKAEVVFGGTWEEDSSRRDFTFNSLYLDISDKNNYKIYDYHNGIEDLVNKKVKFIGDYKKRIEEDYLRIMRFIRFFLRYGKNQEKNYKEEIKQLYEFIPSMNLLSIERILMEIKSILKTEKWLLGIKILNEIGINNIFFKKDLFINEKLKNFEPISINNKILIIFHKIDLKIIEKLPIEKKLKNTLKMYIQSDWSLKYFSKILYKEKNFDLISNLLNLFYIINNTTNENYEFLKNNKKFFDIFLFNKKSIDFNQEFTEYKKKYIFKNLEGHLRGIEELQVRFDFIKNLIYNY
jgi:tRNA nucleotidyltransferase/poly(A) polymerase